MPKLILHVGIPKTGSSAIQSALARNMGNLLEQGILYPDFKSLDAARAGFVSSGNGIPLGKVLNVSSLASKNVDSSGVRACLDEGISRGLNVLYSSESLIGFEENALRMFMTEAEAMGYQVIFAAYVRSLADLAISSHHQQIKRHRCKLSFSDFAKDFNAPGLRGILRLNRIVGPDRLILRNYDAAKRNLIDDFFTTVLQVPEPKRLLLDNPTVNRSLSDSEIQILLEINRVISDDRISGIVSDAMIYGDQNLKYQHTILPADRDILQTNLGQVVQRINKLAIDSPISISSGDILISSESIGHLSETEIVLGRIIGKLFERVEELRRAH